MVSLAFFRPLLLLDVHSGICLANLSKSLAQVAKANSPTVGLVVLDWAFRPMMYRETTGVLSVPHGWHI